MGASSFAGQVALVTGAASGSGIGRAAALGFAAEGARVAVCDVDVANAVLFLGSDQASFITGHALPGDGGMLA